MRLGYFFVFLFLIICCEGYATANPKTIEVFYVKTEVAPVSLKGVNISFHQLDRSKSLEQSINIQLPGKLDKALQYMREYAGSVAGKEKIDEIVSGYQGIGRAFILGVKELPAVVIDGVSVVYGTTDVLKVLDIWRKHEEVHRRNR